MGFKLGAGWGGGGGGAAVASALLRTKNAWGDKVETSNIPDANKIVFSGDGRTGVKLTKYKGLYPREQSEPFFYASGRLATS